jgi:hypothetical protein
MARRFVEPVLRELSAAGHDMDVTLLTGPAEPFPSAPSVTVEALSSDPDLPPTVRGSEVLRTFASYVALRERWRPLMRARWLEYFPAPLSRGVRAIDRLGLARVLDSRPTRWAVRRAALALPAPRALREHLRARAPDVVVLSPMIYPGTRELDVVGPARRRGVPTVGLVMSWDNLTSKATFLRRPDLLLVWNEAQKREAVEWHGFPAGRVEALGAPVFDHLFERTELPTRAQLLQSLGLASGADYALYAVSSRLGLDLGGEVEVVRRLGAELARSGGDGAMLVVRPHPRNAAAFDQELGSNVKVTAPPDFPASEQAQIQLHALLAHADAVVGLNTSLFIEAAIVGTPTISIALSGDVDPHRMSSSLTHFDHLRRAGFLHLVDGPAEAAAAVAAIRGGGDPREAERQAFVESFVRPRGLDRAAATLVAERLVSAR